MSCVVFIFGDLPNNRCCFSEWDCQLWSPTAGTEKITGTAEDPGISSLTSGFVIISVINVSAEFICSLLLISQLVTRYCLPVSRGICRETRLTQSGHKTLRQHHLPDFLFPDTLVVALQVSRESRQRHLQKHVMPISLEFTDKSMLVIGGERGIGFAISKDLAEAGADVVISYTSKDATFVAEEL